MEPGRRAGDTCSVLGRHGLLLENRLIALIIFIREPLVRSRRKDRLWQLGRDFADRESTPSTSSKVD